MQLNLLNSPQRPVNEKRIDGGFLYCYPFSQLHCRLAPSCSWGPADDRQDSFTNLRCPSGVMVARQVDNLTKLSEDPGSTLLPG